MGGAVSICPSSPPQTYPTMMKLGTGVPYLNMIQKINQSCETPRYVC